MFNTFHLAVKEVDTLAASVIKKNSVKNKHKLKFVCVF